MANSFYEQIEDEEASRLAKRVTTEAELKITAEASRVQYYLGTSRTEISLRSTITFGAMIFVGHYFEENLLLAMTLVILILELSRIHEKLDATTQLLLLKTKDNSQTNNPKKVESEK